MKPHLSVPPLGAALILATLCALALGGCTVEPAPAVRERVLTLAERGTHALLSEDELVTIELDARPSAGFTWDVVAVDPRVLALASREHLSAPALGGVDRERLRFTGVGAGTTAVTLVYHRPWEEPSEGDAHYTIEVQVSGAYTGAWRAPAPAATTAVQALGETVGPARLNLCDPGDGGYTRCTPIKNQGDCGGCWAFATAGVFENLLYFANPSVTPSLSEQYLISCNAKGYTCAEGGNVAFDYYRTAYVSPPESAAGAVYTTDFPFQAADVACGSRAHPHHEKLASWARINGNPASVEVLKEALMTAGPVWTAVCADTAFSNYRYRGSSASDIFRGHCTDLNHAVILVGWDDNGGDGYWFLRNSWGNKWGDRGYMRIAYGANGIGSDSSKAVYGTQPPVNAPPIADAGPAQVVLAGATVTLDGSGSRDPDGTIASYAWSTTSGGPVALSGAASVRATFAAPDVTSSTELTFTLTVTDNRGARSSSSVVVTVEPQNRPPVADAGPPQTVAPGSTVTLDGRGSVDPDGTIATYAWSTTSGGPVTLAGATGAQATFVAPAVTTPSELAFTLTVTDDDGASGRATVLVTVAPANQPPVASAGPSQTVAQGSSVSLDGRGSTDADGVVQRYAWSQRRGAAVTLVGATTSTPTFLAPTAAGELVLELTVTDDAGATASAEVVVTVLPLVPGTTSSPGPSAEFERVVGSGCGVADPAGLAPWGLTLILAWAWRPRRGGR
jgi:predicted secreted protein